MNLRSLKTLLFHFNGLVFASFMVKPHKVENTVDHELGEPFVKGYACFVCLSHGRLHGNDKIPQQPGAFG